MSDLKVHNWIHIHSGTTAITKDNWQKIKNLPYQNKPLGGLWLSKYNGEDYNICEWLNFIQDEIEEKGEYSELYRMASSYSGGFLIKLKADAKILTVENQEDIEKVKEQFLLDKALDYEKISEIYDGIYINLYALPAMYWDKENRNCLNLSTWGCRTLLIFNFEAIKSYESIDIETIIDLNGSISYKLKKEKEYRKEYYERKKTIKKRN